MQNKTIENTKIKHEIKGSSIDSKRLEDIKIMIQVGKFSFNILHDLINPITGLSLYLDTIKDEKLKNSLKPIFSANSEIRNFLSTFQETVSEPNKIEKVDVEQVIKSALVLIDYKAKKHNVYLSFSRNISGVKIKMNKLNLYQIILNLVGNSIDSFHQHPNQGKFKNERKFVSISLSENINNYRLTISDNGSGIKKKNIDKIFDEQFTTKKHGFGIGLNTVREIVENKIGGQIKIRTSWGDGTKFHIYLPKEKISQ
jgi:signal transduction histidine kinase